MSCDACDNWRRVKKAPTADAKWTCSDKSDAKHNNLSVPQELPDIDAAIDVKLAGGAESAELASPPKGAELASPPNDAELASPQEVWTVPLHLPLHLPLYLCPH